MPGVARGIKKNILKKCGFWKQTFWIFSLCYLKGIHGFPQKIFSQFGSAVWSAIADICINIYILFMCENCTELNVQDWNFKRQYQAELF